MFGLDRVVFIPASPPHKANEEIGLFAYQCRWFARPSPEIPILKFPMWSNGAQASRIPSRLFRISRRNTPQDTEIYFIVGQDAFQAIQTWKDWENLLVMCHFVVMTRPGYESKSLAGIVPDALADTFGYRGEQTRGFYGPRGHNAIFPGGQFPRYFIEPHPTGRGGRAVNQVSRPRFGDSLPLGAGSLHSWLSKNVPYFRKKIKPRVLVHPGLAILDVNAYLRM